MKPRSLVLPAVLIGFGGAAALVAGPLNPPAGPVASSYKTLNEVEPRIAINQTNTPGDADSLFKLAQPGSYYLTGNATGVVGKHGIEIAASGVTIDLSGFDLTGVAGMGAFDGVSTTVVGLTNITLVNGSVRNWGGHGVKCWATNCRGEGVFASGNASSGIYCGDGVILTNCAVHDNGGDGIVTLNGATISHCSAYENGGHGIYIAGGGTVSDCSARINGRVGIKAHRVSNCSAHGNGEDGIIGNAISICFATYSGGYGIFAYGTASGCDAEFNAGGGIYASDGGTVADCTARYNRIDGIVCSIGCTIRGNTCHGNGNGGDGAGIHAISRRNRLEGNNCADNDRGIDVDGNSNTIDGNSCAGNGVSFDVDGIDNIVTRNRATGGSPNYSIIAGNSVAPRVSVTDSDGWAGIANADHPWANFGY